MGWRGVARDTERGERRIEPYREREMTVIMGWCVETIQSQGHVLSHNPSVHLVRKPPIDHLVY